MGSSSFPEIWGESEFVGAKVYTSAAFSIPNSAQTPIAFDVESFDTHGFHDNSTNNTRLTIPAGRGGKYLVLGGVYYSGSSTGSWRQTLITKNGSIIVDSNDMPINTAAHRVDVMTVLSLVPGDYIEIQSWQNTGGALSTYGSGEAYTSFACYRLGPSPGGSLPQQNSSGLLAHATSSSSGTTTSPTYVDFDATWNATFIAPGSGKVLVRIAVFLTGDSTGVDIWMGLRSGVSDVSGSAQRVFTPAAVNRPYVRTHYSAVISGLIPGTQYSWKPSWRVNPSGTGTWDGSTGAALLEVWSVD